MDFARQQRNPTRHLVGIGGVVLFHVLLIWGLMSGLARKVVEVVKGPIEVKVIEEVVKKPPPPPEVVPPPPKLAAPPPPFIPPPEINIAPPPVPPPTITQVTQEAPPAPQAPVIAPPPVAVAPPAPPPPPQPAVRSAQVACANYREVMSTIQYPREALLDGIEGEVVIEFTVTGNGQIRDPVIKSSSHRVFNRVSLAVVNRLQCQGQGQDIRVQAPVSFKIR
jgi:protein TonB